MKSKQTRLCRRCLKQKPRADFLPHQARGRWCRACYTAYFATYNKRRYASPEARKAELERGKVKYWERLRVARMERKRRLIALFGGKCSRCGYAVSAAALDFDHIPTRRTHRGRPNRAKRRTLSHLLALADPRAFKLAIREAAKCRLLCSNCHRELTFPGHELNKPLDSYAE